MPDLTGAATTAAAGAVDPITLLSVGAGLGQLAYGAIQNARAKKQAQMNPRPDYVVPQEYAENLSDAEARAQTGFGDDTLTRMHQNALRGLSASLTAGLQAGAMPNTVNDYYQSYLDNAGEVGMKDSLQRFQNVNSLFAARDQMAQQKFIEFGYNRDAPFKDAAQASSLQGQQSLTTIGQGVSGIINSFANDTARKLYTRQTESNNASLSVPDVEMGRTTDAVPLIDIPKASPIQIATQYLNNFMAPATNTPPATGLYKNGPGRLSTPEDFYFQKLLNNNTH